MKQVEMFSFFNVGLANITLDCYVKNLTSNPFHSRFVMLEMPTLGKLDISTCFLMFHYVISTWLTNIKITSVPRRVLAGHLCQAIPISKQTELVTGWGHHGSL